MKKKTLAIFCIILLGALVRLYLAVTLPIWHDEAYSLWAAEQSITKILTGVTEPGHPPGYYVLLHFWGLISLHLFWFRFLSVAAFIINAYLFKVLGDRLKKPQLSLLFVFLYSFSGYFIIFDWQVRMYTLTVTTILFSLLLLDTYINSQKRKATVCILSFIGINTLGLYIDFSFLWYFLPVSLWLCGMAVINRKIKNTILCISTFVSGLVFLVLHPTLMQTYTRGIEGIEWMKPYLNPTFFVPYFLGTHTNWIVTAIFIILCIAGFIRLFSSTNRSIIMNSIVCSAIVSVLGTLLYSYAFTPLFHVRSLQIAGISVIVLIGFAIADIRGAYKTYIYLLLGWVVLLNFAVIVFLIPVQPQQFLINYFPWKNILSHVSLRENQILRYKALPELPTPILFWGLTYSIKGNESYPPKLIPSGLLQEKTPLEVCTVVYDWNVELDKCTLSHY
jgi:hypothetical protein